MRDQRTQREAFDILVMVLKWAPWGTCAALAKALSDACDETEASERVRVFLECEVGVRLKRPATETAAGSAEQAEPKA
jgi:hypothetical protein